MRLSGVLLAGFACVGLCAGGAGAVAQGCDGTIAKASYGGPTGRYPHGVLGDRTEWSVLTVEVERAESCADGDTRLSRTLPGELVFEDVAPRLVDLDGDGRSEVVVVESHQSQGARLAVWGLSETGFGRIAATPFIGTRFRWLAPIGAADLDGDGHVEIAYIDRPHLARVLRVWRFENGKLREVAAAEGFTNHRIGESDIAGGIRTCGDAPEMIVASADWTRVLAVRFENGALSAGDVGPHKGRGSFSKAMDCR